MTDLDPQLQAALNRRAAEALTHWRTSSAPAPQLLKYRENVVFRVEIAGEPAAMRIHRAGYHQEAELKSELAWTSYLRSHGLPVPCPVAALAGDWLVRLPRNSMFEEQYVDVLDWIEGSRLGHSGVPLEYGAERLRIVFRALGAAIGRMHTVSDEWTVPSDFVRPAWDFEGLLGEAPFWGRFWDCPALSEPQRERLSHMRATLKLTLRSLQAGGLDYGLIHADLGPENILLEGDRVTFLDFDDCGFGWRLFDLATVLLAHRSEPGYEVIESALIAGYRSQRLLSDADLTALPTFLVLRSLTYISWIAARPEIPGARVLLAQIIERCFSVASKFGVH